MVKNSTAFGWTNISLKPCKAGLRPGLRKQLAEHPFGTIKHAMDQGYFLLRGLEKVRAETPALAAQVQVWP